MNGRPLALTLFSLAWLVLASLLSCTLSENDRREEGALSDEETAPAYEVDPFWPKPLPNEWILGQVAGVAVDSRDHVWIVHRPGSLTPQEIGA
ncbi:MAG: hypothetical protein ACWGSD_13500, partial [Thermodesulfobacteriota bacterium]